MAVIVSKVDAADVPHEHPHQQGDEVFKVTDEKGQAHYVNGEEAAAKLAVDLSEPARTQS